MAVPLADLSLQLFLSEHENNSIRFHTNNNEIKQFSFSSLPLIFPQVCSNMAIKMLWTREQKNQMVRLRNH